MPFFAELGEEPVDLLARADVHAARRLVEEEHVRGHLEPLADDDLLLVAAGERRHRDSRRTADAELVDALLGEELLLLVVDEADPLEHASQHAARRR